MRRIIEARMPANAHTYRCLPTKKFSASIIISLDVFSERSAVVRDDAARASLRLETCLGPSQILLRCECRSIWRLANHYTTSRPPQGPCSAVVPAVGVLSSPFASPIPSQSVPPPPLSPLSSASPQECTAISRSVDGHSA